MNISKKELQALKDELAQAKYHRDRAYEKVAKLEQEVREKDMQWMNTQSDWITVRSKWMRAVALWNEWIEAEKGMYDPDGLATVRFPREKFCELFSLLKP